MAIGGEFIKKQNISELNFDLNFKVEIFPVDIYGDLTFDADDFTHLREHKLNIVCKKDEDFCESEVYAVYPLLEHEIYKVVMKIDVPEEVKNEITGMYFEVFVVNEKYTKFLIVLRYTFLAISILMTLIYLIFFLRTPVLARTFEHKAVAILSVLLIFFNDPFYYLTIYKVSKFMAFLSTFQVVLFLTFLIFFWSVMLQRIHQEKV